MCYYILWLDSPFVFASCSRDLQTPIGDLKPKSNSFTRQQCEDMDSVTDRTGTEGIERGSEIGPCAANADLVVFPAKLPRSCNGAFRLPDQTRSQAGFADGVRDQKSYVLGSLRNPLTKVAHWACHGQHQSPTARVWLLRASRACPKIHVLEDAFWVCASPCPSSTLPLPLREKPADRRLMSCSFCFPVHGLH